MTLYVHDGIEFDLDRTYMDVVGVEWRWTGQRNEHGEPLMLGAGPQTPIPLPDVYHDHGPLIALDPKPSAADYRAAIDEDYAATMAAGYIESLAAYELRIGGVR